MAKCDFCDNKARFKIVESKTGEVAKSLCRNCASNIDKALVALQQSERQGEALRRKQETMPSMDPDVPF